MSDESFYPEPPVELRKPSVKHALAYIGPGVIIASVTIGSGELVFASRSGAIFGYSLLWCFLFAGVFKAIQVYTAARHITLTGEHPMVAWKDLPGPPYWLPLMIALPAVLLMPIAFSAIPEILGGYIHWLANLGESGENVGTWAYQEFAINVWATWVLFVCLGLALYSSYTILERASIVVLGVLVLCVGAAVVTFRPQLTEILSGMFVPTVPDFPDWLLKSETYGEAFRNRSPWLEISIYLGAVGGGAYDYIGYVGMLREKKWGLAGRRVASFDEIEMAVDSKTATANETVQRARQWMRAPLFDTFASFFMVVLVTLLFAILGTLVLHAEHAVPANNELLNAQETFMTVLHPELRWVYRTGVFLAFIGTLYGAFEVYQYTFIESVAVFVPSWSSDRHKTILRRSIIAYCFLGGLLMVWLPETLAGNIVERMTFGSIVSGALACGLWCFAMLWTDYTRLPKPLRMNIGMRMLTVLAGVSMTFLGIVATYVYFTTGK